MLGACQGNGRSLPWECQSPSSEEYQEPARGTLGDCQWPSQFSLVLQHSIYCTIYLFVLLQFELPVMLPAKFTCQPNKCLVFQVSASISHIGLGDPSMFMASNPLEFGDRELVYYTPGKPLAIINIPAQNGIGVRNVALNTNCSFTESTYSATKFSTDFVNHLTLTETQEWFGNGIGFRF